MTALPLLDICLESNCAWARLLTHVCTRTHTRSDWLIDWLTGWLAGWQADTSYMRTGSRKRGCSRGRALANGLWWAGGQIAGLWWYNSLSPFGDVLEWWENNSAMIYVILELRLSPFGDVLEWWEERTNSQWVVREMVLERTTLGIFSVSGERRG